MPDIYLKTLQECDLKQKEIANKLGINVRTLQNYLGGRKMPTYIQKLIEHEFINKVEEKPEQYKTAQDTINELQKRLLDKDETINSQREHIQSLKEQIQMLKFQLDQRKTAN